MIASEDPWAGLGQGGPDSRRVDHGGRFDFFWVALPNGEPGLMLLLAEGVGDVLPLPRMRNLELRYQDLSGRRGLVLVLHEPEHRDLFLSLCKDIVSAGEAATDGADALDRSIRRTLRWHHLLRRGSNDKLSLEEQRGLMGELQFLRRLIDLIGPRAAIEAWKGPLGASKDFELGTCLIEVKARRGAAKPYVQISSEDQLSDVADRRLFLVVGAIDAVVKPSGMTLTDHVREIDKLFMVAEPEASNLWEVAILATGFSFDDEYSDRRWIVGTPIEFEVVPGFPRISTPVPVGVLSVRYAIGLDACASFEAPESLLDEQIVEGSGPWTN